MKYAQFFLGLSALLTLVPVSAEVAFGDRNCLLRREVNGTTYADLGDKNTNSAGYSKSGFGGASYRCNYACPSVSSDGRTLCASGTTPANAAIPGKTGFDTFCKYGPRLESIQWSPAEEKVFKMRGANSETVKRDATIAAIIGSADTSTFDWNNGCPIPKGTNTQQEWENV